MSGAGKTTVLKAINRLIDPDRGEVRIDGKPVVSVNAPALRRQIGYVVQGAGLFPHLRVGENISVTPRLLGWSKADVASRAAELLDLVELPQAFAARLPAELSGISNSASPCACSRRTAPDRFDGRTFRRARPCHA
jgi:osmoprotectant transport system ATP-binding protein